MSNACAVVALVLALGAQDAKDPAEAARARKARINELRKELSSGSEAARIEAIRELGEIRDGDARSLLVEKTTTDTEAVRRSAAKAIILHRKPICAQALGNAIQANGGNEGLVKFLIGTLGELDMCASIPILMAILQGKPSLGDDVLKALVAIGCPEAVPPLVAFLKRAETEARKPDYFEDSLYGGVGGAGRAGGTRTENRTKDKVLAELAPKVRETLAQLTGLQHDTYRDWNAAVLSGAAAPRVITQYRCEETDKTYDILPGKSPKCPHSTKSGHEDVLLKHRRE
jgi:hypothetical protein